MSQEKAEFVECSYCEFQCKYRSIAEKNMKADEDYTKEFFTLFRDGDLDAVSTHIAKETIKIMETKNPDSLLAFGLCLYVIGTNILEIPEVLRRRLGRLAKSKIRTAIKEQLGIAIPAKAIAPAAKAVAPAVAPAKAAVKVPAAAVAPATARVAVEKAAPPAAIAPEILAAEKPGAVEMTAAAKIESWIRNDKEFLYYVDEIIQRENDLVEVKYDLETEGFLTGLLIKVLYSGRDESGRQIMKLGVKGKVDVPYHLNVVMGKTKEGIVAASIPGDLKDEDVLYKKLEEVDLREGQMQMDRLTLMLNRDKFLTKTISKTLILDSFDESKVKSIKIPITIQKRGDQGCDLVVKTFLDERLMRPTDLFVNVMDGVAENLDYLLELPPEERAEVPMAKADWFTIKVKPQAGAFTSKFIKRVALPDIPVCPHCDRPLPKASSTDYRRCPFCYEKL